MHGYFIRTSRCNRGPISPLSRIYLHLALHKTDSGEKPASATRVGPQWRNKRTKRRNKSIINTESKLMVARGQGLGGMEKMGEGECLPVMGGRSHREEGHSIGNRVNGTVITLYGDRWQLHLWWARMTDRLVQLLGPTPETNATWCVNCALIKNKQTPRVGPLVGRNHLSKCHFGHIAAPRAKSWDKRHKALYIDIEMP